MLEITFDPRPLAAGLNNLTENQLPYATMKALNECAVLFQEEERGVMNAGFIIRRPWVTQGVKIDRGDFATKKNLVARVHIEGNRDFLGKFEAGGTRTPRNGNRAFSIPTINAKRNPRAIVADRLRPKNLDFKAIKGGAGTRILKGNQDTFMIQRADGTGVILQRKGRKVGLKKRMHGPFQKGQRHDYALVVLYVLKPRTPVPASLHWAETARRSFTANFPTSFTKWWNEAVRTMKPINGGPSVQGQSLPSSMSI